MVPHVVARKAHQRLQEFSFATPKRLLQQYPAESGSRRSCRVSALTNGMLDGGHGGPPYEVERITASTGRPGQPTLSPEGIADMSIHIAPKAWPSGSARSRVYKKSWSSIGLMSAVPPFAAAARLIASTVSRLSHDRASITSLDVFGGMGRLVKVRHLAWVSSMKLIASLHTMHAAVSSVN